MAAAASLGLNDRWQDLREAVRVLTHNPTAHIRNACNRLTRRPWFFVANLLYLVTMVGYVWADNCALTPECAGEALGWGAMNRVYVAMGVINLIDAVLYAIAWRSFGYPWKDAVMVPEWFNVISACLWLASACLYADVYPVLPELDEGALDGLGMATDTMSLGNDTLLAGMNDTGARLLPIMRLLQGVNSTVFNGTLLNSTAVVGSSLNGTLLNGTLLGDALGGVMNGTDGNTTLPVDPLLLLALYNDLVARAEVALFTARRLEFTASSLDVCTALGWWCSWWASYPRKLGRGFTMDDPDCVSNLVSTFAAAVYVTQYGVTFAQGVSDAAYYITGDWLYLVAAILYVIASLRDAGFFWFAPLAGSWMHATAYKEQQGVRSSRALTPRQRKINEGGKQSDDTDASTLQHVHNPLAILAAAQAKASAANVDDNSEHSALPSSSSSVPAGRRATLAAVGVVEPAQRLGEPNAPHKVRRGTIGMDPSVRTVVANPMSARRARGVKPHAKEDAAHLEPIDETAVGEHMPANLDHAVVANPLHASTVSSETASTDDTVQHVAIQSADTRDAAIESVPLITVDAEESPSAAEQRDDEQRSGYRAESASESIMTAPDVPLHALTDELIPNDTAVADLAEEDALSTSQGQNMPDAAHSDTVEYVAATVPVVHAQLLAAPPRAGLPAPVLPPARPIQIDMTPYRSAAAAGLAARPAPNATASKELSNLPPILGRAPTQTARNVAFVSALGVSSSRVPALPPPAPPLQVVAAPTPRARQDSEESEGW